VLESHSKVSGLKRCNALREIHS